MVFGTTPSYFIPFPGSPGPSVVPGETYFLIKVTQAQAYFKAALLDRSNQLIVTSTVALHDKSTAESFKTIQRVCSVKKNEPCLLGVGQNIVSLVPATMPRLTVGLQFTLARKNRLKALESAINSHGFATGLSLAPTTVATARAVGAAAGHILRAFLDDDERKSLLEFTIDLNIATRDLREGYYVVLASAGAPLPDPQQLSVNGLELHTNGVPVRDCSYVILQVRFAELRTRELNEGAPWEEALRQAEAIAERGATMRGKGGETRQQRVWAECSKHLQAARVLMNSDVNYHRRELSNILSMCDVECRAKVFGEASRPAQGRMVLGIRRWVDGNDGVPASTFVNSHEFAQGSPDAEVDFVDASEIERYETILDRARDDLRSLQLLPH
jgi:hypothetical protein